MKNNSILLCLVLFALQAMVPCAVNAQKKGKKAAAKVVAAPKEDFSLYTDNPICKVLIVDSIVVPVADVVKNIPLPSYLGRFFSSHEYGDALVYENEFADMRMLSAKNAEGHYVLLSQTLTGRQWTTPDTVRINGDFIDVINAFPMPDGQTLYFAARSMDDNEGKTYSLYTTTLNTETGEYLSPQRMPFPFASSADDLYYIEDEVTSVAWLATTRRQPEGMACIYIMQNKQPWTFYDSEETEGRKLKDYALIRSIADTWTTDKERDEVIAQVKEFAAMQKAGTVVKEITTDASLRNRIAEIGRKLDEYRIFYGNADAAGKKGISETIIELEKKLRELNAEYRRLY